MPETGYDCITKESLQQELRASSASSGCSEDLYAFYRSKDLIILDCRSSHEFSESHIRSAVNFSIPSIMLRRLAAGKIDLLSTIKSPDLKERIQHGYKVSLFILYNDVGVQQQQHQHQQQISQEMTIIGGLDLMGGGGGGGGGTGSGLGDTTINVLYKRLKQDGCRVMLLQDGFTNFRQAFPEWCEDDSAQSKELESSRSAQADQLMGLRSLRISTPHSDSACSSSAESSDCESTTHNFSEAPVEIIPGLFLGNESHSCDSLALEKYNIKYVLNVTPDLPNVFEATGDIRYLQIPITDHYSQDLAKHFPTAIQFIEEARSNKAAVLVHCVAGVSRSVTVTLAYLMHTRGLCLNDAFTLVRKCKPDVSPNFHFMEQLHSFERKLRINCANTSECTAMDESGSGMSDPSSALSSCSSAALVGVGGCNVGISVGLSNTLMMPPTSTSGRCGGDMGSKFTCNCIASDCKCMQTGGYIALAKAATGVSPDSGIEFDRWTPSSDTGLK